MPERNHRYHSLLISICLAAAIIAVYWPVYKFDFVKYDDDVYITNNRNIQSGLNLKSLQWAFTSGRASNWHPVTWISHILDYQIFGTWAGGYHLVNVLFHIANTIILFYLLIKMTGAVWSSAFITASFALHPLHVESVAWVAERKDVLSTFFWLLTMWAYVRYVESQKLKWYLSAFVLFVLGLMSKPMLVSVPFVLLMLDYWPLKRKFYLRLLTEKIPFFICSIASCIVTFLVQRHSGAMTDVEIYGTGIRISNVVVSYAAYIAKMIWPDRLAMLYPYPSGGLSMAKVVISALLLVLISIYFIYTGRRHRFLITGWLFYLVTLVPVIGLVQVGAQSMADRYTYMPLTGLFIIIAFGAKEFVTKQRYKLLILPAAAILIVWSVVAGQQVRYWKNSMALFERTLAITQNNGVILTNYIICLNELGRFEQVIEKSAQLLEMKPDSVETLNNMGIALAQTGRTKDAIERFKLAIKYKPDYALSYFNLAITLQNQDAPAEAAACYRQALKIQPNYIGASVNLAAALMELGKTDEAIEVYRQALQFDTDNENLRQLLSDTLKKQTVP